ncbi:MAG TPA: EAL domain-containing protein [Thermoanaerobaculia bacterium]|nr:EAL domain-containing protein [Thermoanaerobaculia bacterium]
MKKAHLNILLAGVAAWLLPACRATDIHQWLTNRFVSFGAWAGVVSLAALGLILRRGHRSLWQSKRALRQSEARFRALLSSLDDFVFTLDRNRRFSEIFGQWTSPFGLTRSAILGMKPSEVFPATADHDGAIARAFDGENVTYEWSMRFNGKELSLRTRLAPLRHEGVTTGIVGIISDVTGQKARDAALHEMTDLLSAVIDASPLAIVTLDPERRLRTANPAAEQLFCFTAEERSGTPLGGPGEPLAAMLDECIRSGSSFTDREVRRRRKDGTLMNLSISAAPLHGDGRVSGIVMLASDITERRKTEEILHRYKLLADSARDIVLFVGSDKRILEANEAAVRTYGYTRSELVGLPIDRICVPDECPLRASDPADTAAIETIHRRKDGSRFPVELSVVSADAHGKRITLVIARDMTERKRRDALEMLLHEIDRKILGNERIDSILTFACDRIAELLELPLVQLSLKGEGGVVAIRQAAGTGTSFLHDIEVRWDDSPSGHGPTGTAIRTGEIQFRQLDRDPGFSMWRDRAARYGFRSALALPLVAQDRVIGAMTIFRRETSRLEQDFMNVLVTFADQIALSLLAAWNNEQIRLQTVALESAANAVLVADSRGVIQWVNPAFARLTGFDAKEAVGQTPRILKSGRQTEAFYQHLWKTIASGTAWSGELYNKRKDGSLYIEEQTITPVRETDGSITHFVAIKQDVTARRRQEERIRFLASHDSLTELPNRRRCGAKIERLCRDSRSGSSAAILLVDVDDFKSINDTVGHMAADQALAELASVLREVLRPFDFLARVGCDEFAIVLEGTSLQEAAGIAERIRAEIGQRRFDLHGQLLDVSVSIGVAPIKPAMDGATVIGHAEAALHSAKEQGRNRVVLYDERLGTKLDQAGRWTARIKSALRDDRFVLWYQPIVHLGSGQPEHYEALVRMVAEDGSTIPPGEFVSSAERAGLMPSIDRWVFDHVLDVLGRHDDIRIFVNISGSSLGDESLLQYIEKRLMASGVAPGRLGFEITESAAVGDLVVAQNWVRRFKDLGCLFAIDDFGVGFSSFSYLRALAADYVKIDRSFVSDLDTNATNRALVQAVRTVANTLGKAVIAEGVENDAHAETLRAIGVELAQGFRWGRPQEDFPAR